MIRAALACAAGLALAACAGTARYEVRPFYDSTGRLICCEASVSSSKDVGTVTVRVSNTPDGFSLDFGETGVSASAPIIAGGGIASSISAAVTSAAAAAVKLTTP
ncbi:MAG: hypothetical protein J0I36_14505 [Pandoraea sp.]|uniref:hypothetical protein n=1 Tax=Pandoraea sp. 64-18 TaxID=1895806 RepID=UPI00096555E3|nr:hypothetical protein [Pandoraea sp. 64-18]MBN9116438.1 hypothetical protein [Pandoraea sp.]OJY23525.1 MAG: hypothetical protein BGP02_04445 [Pandoraea sp. 64-18]